MRPEHLTVALRPRSDFEAVDLGFALVQTHAKAIWRAWFLFVVPVLLLLALAEHALQDTVNIPMTLMWFAKPFADCVVMFVLSRAVFGETITPQQLLRELRRHAGTIFASLTLRRLSLSRSFLLPVHLLEGLKGNARRERIKVLHENNTGPARWITVVGGWMEISILIGLMGLLVALLPGFDLLPFLDGIGDVKSPLAALAWQAGYLITMTIVEPFYVAAGFALYLNRRTQLEAWDIEVMLRQVAARTTGARS